MIPTRAQVLTQARAHLNDLESEVFTDTVLGPFFEQSYRRLHDELLNYGLPRIRKVAYFNLPAYTTVLFPSTAGIADFGELVDDGMEERAYVSATNITAATGTPVVVTAAGHGRSSNDRVQVYGMLGETGGNGEWLVSVSGNDLTLRGSISEGTYSSGGVVTYGTEEWTPVYEVDLSLVSTQQSLSNQLRCFEWRNDAFHFIGSTENRQLKFTYFASGAAPSTGSVGIDNSLDFLAAYTAALASFPNDRVSEGARLEAMCFGVPRKSAGLLHELVNPMVKAQQRVQRQPQAYSPNTGSRSKRRAPYFVV